MDLRKIKKLIELVEESGIDELEIQEGEEAVRISRNRAASQTQQVMLPPAAAPVAAPLPAPAAEAPAAQNNSAPENTINAPMVGTFYASPAPGAKPFISKGQTIKKGDVICIIEAMKMMNQIAADRDGIVQDILTQDGDPVEYGQPMISIA